MINIDSKAYLEARENIVKEIEPTLVLIIEQLKKMVENKEITSFAFRKNDVYYDHQKPIMISVDTLNFSDIRLGLFDDVSEAEKARKAKLTPESKAKLSEINDTLMIFNNYFSKENPLIKNPTYYSTAYVNKSGDFAKETIDMVPEFAQTPEEKAQSKKLKM